MGVMTSVSPHGRPFTVDDLEGMPDDGNRYELIDGMLLVSPAPGCRAHQAMRRASCSSQLRLRVSRRTCGPRSAVRGAGDRQRGRPRLVAFTGAHRCTCRSSCDYPSDGCAPGRWFTADRGRS